jgi:hypothetical protein
LQSSAQIHWQTYLSDQGVASVASWTRKENASGKNRIINIFEYGYIVVVVNWKLSDCPSHHCSFLIPSPFVEITGFWLWSSIQSMPWSPLVIQRTSHLSWCYVTLTSRCSTSAPLLCLIPFQTPNLLLISTSTCVYGCNTRPITRLRVHYIWKRFEHRWDPNHHNISFLLSFICRFLSREMHMIVASMSFTLPELSFLIQMPTCNTSR